MDQYPDLESLIEKIIILEGDFANHPARRDGALQKR